MAAHRSFVRGRNRSPYKNRKDVIMKHFEVNFDGLVGPTHNYAGLSYGNVASQSNAKEASNPKEAAKQGLRKMKALTDLGMVQGVLAPQERPISRPCAAWASPATMPASWPRRPDRPRRAGRLLLRLQHVDRQRRHRLPERRHPGWPHSLYPRQPDQQVPPLPGARGDRAHPAGRVQQRSPLLSSPASAGERPLR